MIDVRCAHDVAQPRQDLFFGVGVHRRQRIVQNQDRGIDDDGARDGRALLLAARQRDAALADQRVVALAENRRRPCRAARPPRAALDPLEPFRSLRRRPASAPPSPRPPHLPHLPHLPTCPAIASSPNATLSASVSENRNGSCGTKPIAPRSTASGISRTSTPSMNTVPGGGSCSRASRLISVDLPEPVGPTSATVCPASMRAETWSRTGRAAVAERPDRGTRSRHGSRR